ncbi:hypothetical protein QT711_03210 [Sporosarcina saromensis]|uniref:Uncharacterized protein n=1 Tax=Sporosarcina saromensis TaxID=359365 RepID=A0ABU4G5F8_9BACL|nr:hypothetical protein [Sporosarcina saromensis]MDW0112179.1 hypothetical protein [Sporosarcina saromensis]
MKKIEVTEIEALEILMAYGISKGEEKETSFYKKNGYINSDKSLDAFLEKLEQIYSYAKLVVNPNSKKGKPYSGKKRLIELGEKREEVVERITGNSNNGYKQNDIEQRMKEFIFNELIKRNEEFQKYEHGMSHSTWASFMGIHPAEESESFVEQASLHLESCYHTKANEFFKPNEIVDEFNRAYTNTRKSVIGNAFKSLVSEGLITTESFYLKGIPVKEVDDDRVSYKAITHEQYEEMKKTREEILVANGSNLSEYFAYLTKKKTEKMKMVYKAVRKGLMKKYGATRFHESIKVEIIDLQNQQSVIWAGDINHLFHKHFIERTKTYRHGSKTYKSSTYFWRRFYYLNTCFLLQFMDESSAIDMALLEDEKANFATNFEKYLYDFDMEYYLERELKDMYFFGDMAEEKKKRHAQRIKTIRIHVEAQSEDDIKEQVDVQLGDFFEVKSSFDKSRMTTIEKVEVKKVNDDMEWLSRFNSRKVVKQQLNDEQKARIQQKVNEPMEGMIDIASIFEDEPVKEKEVVSDFNPFDDRKKDTSDPVKLDVIVDTDDEDEEEYDMVSFHEMLNRRKRINVTETIAKMPKVKGFGWELEEKERQEREALARRKLLHVV